MLRRKNHRHTGMDLRDELVSLTSRPLFFFSLGFVLFWTAFVASKYLFI